MPSQGISLFFEMIFLLGVFIGILALAYVVTKKIAIFKQGGIPQRHMKVVECLGLGQGQALYIVKIANEYHLIGVTKEQISYCFKLEDDTVNFESIGESQFQSYLTNWVKGKQEKDDEKANKSK